jgi:hypothetical protein
MNFRKKIKIFPGFYLNISKSGVSSSIGANGTSVTIGKNGTYLNTGIAGTGLYNRQKIGSKGDNKDKSEILSENNSENEINSTDLNIDTSSSLIELKTTILEAYKEKEEITKEIIKTHSDLAKAKKNNIIARLFLVGFIFKSFKNKVEDLSEYLNDLSNQFKKCKVNIDILIDEKNLELYNNLLSSFLKMSNSNFIWDITSSSNIDKAKSRSTSDIKVSREKVKLELKKLDLIESSYQGMFWQNINGDGDLYIYPSFIIYMDVINDSIELIHIKDFELIFTKAITVEPEVKPLDSLFVKKQWLKTNKDGSPDKRFSGNYELPVYEYGRIELKSKLGLNESYLFSNAVITEEFSNLFSFYKNTFN